MSSTVQKVIDDIKVEELAKMYADHISNEKGEILARVWESTEFKEVYDYHGGYEEKNLL